MGVAWIVGNPDPRTPQGAQGALERTDGKSTQRNGSKSKGSERSRIVGNQSSRRFLGAQGAQESPESKSTQRNGSKSKGSERDPDSPKIKAQEAQAARAQESQESPGNQKCMVLLSKSMVFVKLPISENCNARKKCSRLMTKTDTQSSGFNYAK